MPLAATSEGLLKAASQVVLVFVLVPALPLELGTAPKAESYQGERFQGQHRTQWNSWMTGCLP